jgi:hypothetical protein
VAVGNPNTHHTRNRSNHNGNDMTDLLGRAAPSVRLDAVCRAEDSGEDIDPYDGGWA